MKLALAPVLTLLLSVVSAVEFQAITTEGKLNCPKGKTKVGIIQFPSLSSLEAWNQLQLRKKLLANDRI